MKIQLKDLHFLILDGIHKGNTLSFENGLAINLPGVDSFTNVSVMPFLPERDEEKEPAGSVIAGAPGPVLSDDFFKTLKESRKWAKETVEQQQKEKAELKELYKAVISAYSRADNSTKVSGAIEWTEKILNDYKTRFHND